MVEFRDLVDSKGNVYKKNWPYENGIKALSPNQILKPLTEYVYGTSGFKHNGFKDGHEFENAVELYIRTNNKELAKTLISNVKLKDRLDYLNMWFANGTNWRNRIHYAYFEHTLVACETDIEYSSYVYEIKKTNYEKLSKKKKNVLDLTYLLQCKIQFWCTNKEVMLLWFKENYLTWELYKEFNKDEINLVNELIKYARTGMKLNKEEVEELLENYIWKNGK